MDSPDRNYWNRYSTGDGFLQELKDTSVARAFCRDFIKQNIENNEIGSLTEVGFGGLNEYLSLESFFKDRQGFEYKGLDWTQEFVDSARKRFQNRRFERVDITQYVTDDSLKSDLVYSQHVLEHLPGLEPALSNMISLANKLLINIFFLPPEDEVEKINFSEYPLYHNCYSAQHIKKVCERLGFNAKMFTFSNTDSPEWRTGIPAKEVALFALRSEEGPLQFEYNREPIRF